MKLEHVKLEDIAVFQRGFDITVKEQQEGIVPVISSGGISSHHNEFKVRGPGVVIGRKGTLGTVHYSESDFWPHDTTLWVKDFRGNDPKFVYYFLKTLGLERFDAGASNPTLNRNHIHKLKVKLPNFKVRSKIASILSAYDELIENNTQRIALLEQMAQEIYKEWFVRLRFPGYEEVPLVDGLPQGWERVKIKEFGKVITGKTPSTKVEDYFNGDIPFLKIPDMEQGIFILKTQETLTEKGANSQSKQFVPADSISVSCIGSIGKIAILNRDSQTNQQINSIIIRVKTLREYLYFTLKDMKQTFESFAATGATMGNLSKGKFESMAILRPNKYTLKLYSETVNPIFEEIKILSLKNENLKQTRDLLLPRLISGKLSVEHLVDEPQQETA
jgi:type I restriction enzyme S subunit